MIKLLHGRCRGPVEWLFNNLLVKLSDVTWVNRSVLNNLVLFSDFIDDASWKHFAQCGCVWTSRPLSLRSKVFLLELGVVDICILRNQIFERSDVAHLFTS